MKNRQNKFDKPRGKPETKRDDKPKIRPSLYGVHAVREAWNNPDRKIRNLYITDQATDHLEWIYGVALERPKPITVEKKELDRMLPDGAVHQGIALDCAPLPETDVQDLIIRARDAENSVIVMLDQVTDPHNVGAIMRSCAAFGADGLILQRKHAPEMIGVLAKTACGAVEYVPVAYETNLSRTIEILKEGGYFVYGLDERGDRSISSLKKGGKSVIVLGAEGDGMRRLVAEHCDQLVHLPTKPPIASLNVSNAAAVALYVFCG